MSDETLLNAGESEHKGQVWLSLILCTYGRAEDIGRYISSLVAQPVQDFELIVIDQNLDERVAPHLRAAYEAGIPLRHLRLDKPNLSAARNRGIAVAQGEWLAFPDDDCWYEPETLASLRDATKTQAQASILVADWVELRAAGHHPPADQMLRLTLKAWRSFRGGDASSITLFVRRELAGQLKGFDERLGVGLWFGSGEETDFVLSALTLGACAARASQVRVHHAYVATADLDRMPWRRIWGGTLARSRGVGAIYAKHNLSFWVVLRGFVAPLARGLQLRHGLLGLIQAVATSLGRLQGWIRWPRV